MLLLRMGCRIHWERNNREQLQSIPSNTFLPSVSRNVKISLLRQLTASTLFVSHRTSQKYIRFPCSTSVSSVSWLNSLTSKYDPMFRSCFTENRTCPQNIVSFQHFLKTIMSVSRPTFIRFSILLFLSLANIHIQNVSLSNVCFIVVFMTVTDPSQVRPAVLCSTKIKKNY